MLKRAAPGFTLVELMVAMALGLLVVVAALAFVLALVRTNAEVVLSTRLDQELRATMMLLATDLRRARGGVGEAFANVDVSTESCVRYAYADGGANFRVARMVDGKLARVREAVIDAATCTSPVLALNSDAVEITQLSFTRPHQHARRIDIALTGRLRQPPAYLGVAATRTLRASIAIRSNGG